jgi:hypothetical protein
VKLLERNADGRAVHSHAVECPMCLPLQAPPPMVMLDAAPPPVALSHVLRPVAAARIAALTGAPLPARGPPPLPVA